MNRGVRVWYKQKNRWLKQDEYKINPDGSIATYEVYTTKWQLIREDSTGLHDKNGKEIYENDIVECGPMRIKAVIVFDDGAFCINHNGDLSFIVNNEDIVIIGNAHESLEVVK